MSPDSPPQEEPDPREILDRTSRSFALSIRALPRRMREPVELAYLLARAADTLADRNEVGDETRLARLGALRAALVTGDLPRDAESWADRAPGDPLARAESALVRGLSRLLARLGPLDRDDRGDVVEVVDRLARTMQREIEYFRGATGTSPRPLPDADALSEYTEGIAGCVGSFWTSLASRHAARWSARERHALDVEARRYGRGLQLVNIVRDLPRDLGRGKLFLPGDELRARGLEAADLRDPAALEALRPILEKWEARSRRGLLAGLVYAARLPLQRPGLRFASSLPAAIGLRTLDALREAPHRLDPERPVRIERRTTRRLVSRSAALSLLPRGPLRLASPSARGNTMRSGSY